MPLSEETVNDIKSSLFHVYALRDALYSAEMQAQPSSTAYRAAEIGVSAVTLIDDVALFLHELGVSARQYTQDSRAGIPIPVRGGRFA